MKRYGFQTGHRPELQYAMSMSGPVTEDQVQPEIKALLENPGVKFVALIYDHGTGEKIDVFNAIDLPARATEIDEIASAMVGG